MPEVTSEVIPPLTALSISQRIDSSLADVDIATPCQLSGGATAGAYFGGSRVSHSVPIPER
jgi:hypothetical protein